MQVDERQAAVAYTYAWWMSGDEDAAAAAVRAALRADGPPDTGSAQTQVALVQATRDALGESPGMFPASQVALLHDGLGLPLDAAASIAGVAPDDTTVALAQGRLEALLETVRDAFDHPERLGGLAVGDADEVSHARGCPSCARASTLIDRGRAELQAVAPVSAPPGLLARMVAEVAPPDAETATAPADVAAAPPPDAAADTISVHEVIDAPRDYAVAGDEPPVAERAEGAATATAEPATLPPETEPLVIPEAPPLEPEPAPRRVPTTPGRERAASVLAGAGLVTLAVLVGVWVAQGGPDDEGANPAVQPTDIAEQPTDRATSRPTSPPSEGFGPRPGQRREFAVLDAGLLLSGETAIAPSSTQIAPTDSIRIAVDYANATKGVRLNAVWRVDDKPFQRLSTVVSGRRSRHVWGVPQPEAGWPPGRHHVVLTANDSVAGAVDFTVR